MTWRWWLGWAAAGCAGILAHRGDWWQAVAPLIVVVMLVAWRVRNEMAATRDMLRGLAELSEESARLLDSDADRT